LFPQTLRLNWWVVSAREVPVFPIATRVSSHAARIGRRINQGGLIMSKNLQADGNFKKDLVSYTGNHKKGEDR
jgi:hypothetical protein